MSADNWAVCPRCLDAANDEYERAHAAVMASYGTVSVDEFDAAREELQSVNVGDYQTFREDYEFYGANEGEVQAVYRGGCSKCGLRTELKASKRFWPEALA